MKEKEVDKRWKKGGNGSHKTRDLMRRKEIVPPWWINEPYSITPCVTLCTLSPSPALVFHSLPSSICHFLSLLKILPESLFGKQSVKKQYSSCTVTHKQHHNCIYMDTTYCNLWWTPWAQLSGRYTHVFPWYYSKQRNHFQLNPKKEQSNKYKGRNQQRRHIWAIQVSDIKI